jgi:hypothetical protein
MHKPNYKNGSIVNLMSSIRASFGGKSIYELLLGFDYNILNDKNVVLLAIDGLGYDFLMKYGQNSFLHKHLIQRITSVSPATTATAMTAFSTGVPAQQHGLTGWYTYLKEIDIVSIILRFTTRGVERKISKKLIKYSDVYTQKSFFENLNADCYSIKPKEVAYSDYSKLTDKNSKVLPFSSLNGCFRQINKAIKGNAKRKYILTYWLKFDSYCHDNGTDSQIVREHFKELDHKVQLLDRSLKGTNTAIIITADHGIIDTKDPKKIIRLKEHPQLAETLRMPLSGDRRAVYCYVKPDKIKEFKDYVTTELKDACEMHKSSDLIKQNYFGLFTPNPKLRDRVGDYTLIMKDDYIIRDQVPGEEEKIKIGNHGGMSIEEMYVPLIVIT